MKMRLTALLLLLALALTGCGARTQAADLMEDVAPEPMATEAADSTAEPMVTEAADSTAGTEDAAQAVTDFAVRLFQQCAQAGDNTLVSPVSVLYALAMTANGAAENTLAQMEAVFGVSMETLNPYLSAYMENLPSGEDYKLTAANAIWFREDERLTVRQEFLQTNANYYNADIYQAPFDQGTLEEINSYVSEHTDGMVEDILDKISDDAVMYLVNALAFDAQWQTIYKENEVRSGDFTLEDGTVREAELMYSEESVYLEDENATGFIKYYKDGAYAFVALLPNEGVTVADYVASLTGAGLTALLENAQDITVEAAIPKFTSEYSAELSEALAAMGMTDAFDIDLADFSLLGEYEDGNICISRVLHKTYIAVDERGTQAGAATVVEMVAETALEAPEETKTVYLNRPFVYLLIDCGTNTPIFMGTVMDAA
ncbi:MAG: serpin family protein [Oscillospiraceae bacterium]|nr:serpin family protein [Oscillospiraceae bacterium]